VLTIGSGLQSRKIGYGTGIALTFAIIFRGFLQMRLVRWALFGTATLILFSAPAFASGGNASVPEPNMVTLLTLASAGVMIGRRMSSKAPPQD
jgi:hypothetical protein